MYFNRDHAYAHVWWTLQMAQVELRIFMQASLGMYDVLYADDGSCHTRVCDSTTCYLHVRLVLHGKLPLVMVFSYSVLVLLLALWYLSHGPW